MVHLVCLFMKMHLLALLQDDCHDLVCEQVVCMCEEYNSSLSTPTEAKKSAIYPRSIYQYNPNIGRPLYWSISNSQTWCVYAI